MQRVLSFLSGVLTGALVGAAVALLFAPESGEEVRLQIQERSIRLKDDIKAVADTRRAELERELEALRSPYKKEEPQ
jgi:gas vesicle protein